MINRCECDGCLHDKICAFKDEFLAACDAIRSTTYEVGSGSVVKLIDSTVDVHIKCPHGIVQSNFRSSEQLSKLF